MAIVMAWGAMQRDVLSFPRSVRWNDNKPSKFLSFPRTELTVFIVPTLLRGNAVFGAWERGNDKKIYRQKKAQNSALALVSNA
jgi:hypothetical protein